MITASRFHDFSYGHRVHEHESKCAHLHGHNGRVHFTVRPLLRRRLSVDLVGDVVANEASGLDKVGRVLDFSVINSKLCQWVENSWDHKFLVSEEDPWAKALVRVDPSVVLVPFNPTAERMAEHLLYVVGPLKLRGTGCELVKVVLEETRKCSAAVILKL